MDHPTEWLKLPHCGGIEGSDVCNLPLFPERLFVTDESMIRMWP